MKSFLFLLTLLPLAAQACPTCYGTSVEYAPPFFADEFQQQKSVQARMTQRPAYTQNYSSYPPRTAPVMPRYGKRNSVGRDIKKPALTSQESYVQDLDNSPALR